MAVSVLVSGQTPEEVSLLLADLTWLYGTRLRVAARYRDGDGEGTHVASVELLPAADPFRPAAG